MAANNEFEGKIEHLALDASDKILELMGNLDFTDREALDEVDALFQRITKKNTCGVDIEKLLQ